MLMVEIGRRQSWFYLCKKHGIALRDDWMDAWILGQKFNYWILAVCSGLGAYKFHCSASHCSPMADRRYTNWTPYLHSIRTPPDLAHLSIRLSFIEIDYLALNQGSFLT